MTGGRYLPFIVMLGPLIGLGLVAVIFRLPINLLLAACVVAVGEAVLIGGLIHRSGRAPRKMQARQQTPFDSPHPRSGGSR